jgi:hypothetical protein
MKISFRNDLRIGAPNLGRPVRNDLRIRAPNLGRPVRNLSDL